MKRLEPTSSARYKAKPDPVLVALSVFAVLMLGFCVFGMVMSYKQGKKHRLRCEEIGGTRQVYRNPSLCLLPNGRMIDTSSRFYKERAEALKDK